MLADRAIADCQESMSIARQYWHCHISHLTTQIRWHCRCRRLVEINFVDSFYFYRKHIV